MGILAGKNVLVVGVSSEASIGYKVAEIAKQQGAKVVVANLERALAQTKEACAKIDPEIPVIALDVTNEEQLAALPKALGEYFDRLDGIVHSVAFANPKRALGGAFCETQWKDVGMSLQTSSYSLVSLTMACKELLSDSASVVGMSFDAKVTWPSYDWMGVAKAALESASRYLARYLGPAGVRCNIVSAGPIDTIAKMAIPGGEEFNEIWAKRAPLGWDPKDATSTAKAVVALLSDWFSATTGEVIYVDGGLHSTGA